MSGVLVRVGEKDWFIKSDLIDGLKDKFFNWKLLRKNWKRFFCPSHLRVERYICVASFTIHHIPALLERAWQGLTIRTIHKHSTYAINDDLSSIFYYTCPHFLSSHCYEILTLSSLSIVQIELWLIKACVRAKIYTYWWFWIRESVLLVGAVSQFILIAIRNYFVLIDQTRQGYCYWLHLFCTAFHCPSQN